MAQRGLIQVATELETRARPTPGVAPPPDNGMADAFNGKGGLTSSLSGIAAEIGKLADHASEREAQTPGRFAGMDPEFRPRNDGTIYGNAFDKAALETYRARAHTQIENEIRDLALKHQASPDKLQQEIEARKSGWLNQVPSELRPEVDTYFLKGGAVAVREATRQLWARNAAEQAGTSRAELETQLRSMQQRAMAAGLDPTADAVLESDLAKTHEILRRKGPDGAPLFSPVQAASLMANAKEEIQTARVYGAFDRLTGLEAKAAFIDKFVSDFQGSKGGNQVFDLKTFETVKRHLEGELRRVDAQARVGEGIVKQAVKEVQHRADKGYAVDPDEILALRSRVAQSRDPEMLPALDDAMDSLQVQRWARTLPLAQLQNEVSKLRTGLEAAPPSVGDRGRSFRRLERLEALLRNAQSEVKTNPLGWDERAGMIKITPLGTVNLRELGALEGWGAERIAQADAVAERHGIAPKYLTPIEREGLAHSFRKGGAEGVAVMSGIVRVFGDRADKVIAEVETRDALAGGQIGRLMLDAGPSSPAIKDGADGLALKSTDGYKSLVPKGSDKEAALTAVAGRALDPKTREAVMDLTDAMYDVRARRKGVVEFDRSIYERAARDAMGERQVNGKTFGGIANQGWWNPEPILLPSYVRNDAVPHLLEMLNLDDLRASGAGVPSGADGKPIALSRLRGGTLKRIGDGRYAIGLGNVSTEGSEQWVVDQSGKKMILDFGRLAPRLRMRRPELFADGPTASPSEVAP